MNMLEVCATVCALLLCRERVATSWRASRLASAIRSLRSLSSFCSRCLCASYPSPQFETDSDGRVSFAQRQKQKGGIPLRVCVRLPARLVAAQPPGRPVYIGQDRHQQYYIRFIEFIKEREMRAHSKPILPIPKGHHF